MPTSSLRIIGSMALALLMLLFATPLVAETTTKETSEEPKALGFVPESTLAVVAFDIDRLNTSSIFTELLTTITSQEAIKKIIDEFQSSTGFDYERDVDSLYVVVPQNVADKRDYLILIEGSIEIERMLEFAGTFGAKLQTFEHGTIGYHLIDGQVAMTYHDGVLLIGTEAALKDALDARGGTGKALASNNELATLVIDESARHVDVWWASAFTDAMRTLIGQHNVMLQDILKVYGSLDLASGVHFRLVMDTASNDAARSFEAAFLENLTALQNDKTIQQLGLADAIGEAKVEAIDEQVSITLDLDDNQIQAVVAIVESLISTGPIW